MSEIISIHIGNSGIGVGSAYWNSLLNHFSLSNNINENTNRIFQESTTNNSLIPRALFFDTEEFSINSLSKTRHWKSFESLSKCFNLDSGNIYSYTREILSKIMMPEITESIRKQVESCQKIDGFILNLGTGGGTGSGLASCLYRYFQEEFNSIPFGSVLIYPCYEMGETNVEPYNSSFSISEAVKSCSFVLPFDNLALYNIARRSRVQDPGFEDLNQIIAQSLSAFTSPFQLENIHLADYLTQIIPEDILNIISPSFRPSAEAESDWQSLTTSVFSSDNSLIREPKSSPQIKKGLIIRKSKTDEPFPELSFPEPYLNISDRSYKLQPSQDVSLFSTSSQILGLLENHTYDFDVMFSRRAFAYWFVQHGMEENEFSDSRETIEEIVNCYTFID